MIIVMMEKFGQIPPVVLEKKRDFGGLDDPNFDRKLDLIIAGANPFLKEHLLTRISRENCIVIIAYVLAMQTEINPSQRYRIDTIHKLKHLAEFHRPKSFRDMTRQDILDYLDRVMVVVVITTTKKAVAITTTANNILLLFILAEQHRAVAEKDFVLVKY